MSFKGNNYMLVTYSYKINTILGRLLKSKKGYELTLAFEEIRLCEETEALDLSITFYTLTLH